MCTSSAGSMTGTADESVMTKLEVKTGKKQAPARVELATVRGPGAFELARSTQACFRTPSVSGVTVGTSEYLGAVLRRWRGPGT